MRISGNMGRIGILRGGNRTNQAGNTKNAANVNQYNNWMNASRGSGDSGVEAAKSAAEKRRMLSRDKRDEQDMPGSRGIVEQSLSYADSLRKARTQKKSTNQRLKKLRYSYKSISSQLMRSKTSIDAARVARKARRELASLKGKRLYENGKYNSYELEAAITHAQAMVRVARKKVRHLEEEELMKIRGGPCAGELEERKEEELTEEERDYLEQQPSGSGMGDAIGGEGEGYSALGNGGVSSVVSQRDVLAARQEQAQAYEEAMRQADIQEEMRMMELRRAREESASMADAMAEMTDEMTDSMRKMLDEMGLSELAESTSGVGVEMDPPDYKMMKLKHRLEEMMAIAEADSKYLKAMFNKFEKAKEASAQAVSSANSGNNSIGAGSGSGGMVVAVGSGGATAQTAAPAQTQAIDVVSTPEAVSTVAAAPVEGGCVDVSV